jgi:transposase
VFGLGLATKIYVAIEAVDMRKGFEELYWPVRDQLGQDPLSGYLFLFSNRTRTRLKALLWDDSGLWVCATSLEKGRFRWPEMKEKQRSVSMRAEELAMLVNGLDLKQAQARKVPAFGIENSGTFSAVRVF